MIQSMAGHQKPGIREVEHIPPQQLPQRIPKQTTTVETRISSLRRSSYTKSLTMLTQAAQNEFSGHTTTLPPAQQKTIIAFPPCPFFSGTFRTSGVLRLLAWDWTTVHTANGGVHWRDGGSPPAGCHGCFQCRNYDCTKIVTFFVWKVSPA